jgi:UDP-3-O-[3-hydroxymyristoyl] glucosamine N-acyltransferase
MKLKDLAQVCEAKLEGDAEHDVSDVARPGAAKPQHVCFINDKKYLRELEGARPGAVIAQPGMALPQGLNVLRHADPDLAFSKAINALRGEAPKPLPGIHESAVIGERFEAGEGAHVGAYAVIGADVKLGRNVVVYPHCTIGDGVFIGDDTIVYPNVTILERCTIGRRCILHSGVVIGSDGFGFHFVGGAFQKAPQRGTVEIEDDVELGANTTVDRARFDVTRIGKGTKIDNLVQVAHNVQIGQHCAIAAQVGIAGTSVLKDYVMLGGQAGISDHITIGMGAQISAKSAAIQDVAPGMKMMGLPVMEGREYMKREAMLRRLPDKLRGVEELLQKLIDHVGLPPEDDS